MCVCMCVTKVGVGVGACVACGTVRTSVSACVYPPTSVRAFVSVL